MECVVIATRFMGMGGGFMGLCGPCLGRPGLDPSIVGSALVGRHSVVAHVVGALVLALRGLEFQIPASRVLERRVLEWRPLGPERLGFWMERA